METIKYNYNIVNKFKNILKTDLNIEQEKQFIMTGGSTKVNRKKEIKKSKKKKKRR